LKLEMIVNKANAELALDCWFSEFRKRIFIYQLNESKIVRNYWANMSQVCCLSHLVSAPRREVARREQVSISMSNSISVTVASSSLSTFPASWLKGAKGQQRKRIGTWHLALMQRATCNVASNNTTNNKQHATCNMQWEKGRLACNAIALFGSLVQVQVIINVACPIFRLA